MFFEQAHDAGDPALLVVIRAPCLALIAHFDVPSHEITSHSRHYYIRSDHVYSEARSMRRRIGPRWAELEETVNEVRGWADCYGHCLVATGRADVMLDAVMNPWDCSALLPILDESGGRFTDWRGDARRDGGDAVSPNGVLHDAVLDLLR